MKSLRLGFECWCLGRSLRSWVVYFVTVTINTLYISLSLFCTSSTHSPSKMTRHLSIAVLSALAVVSAQVQSDGCLYISGSNVCKGCKSRLNDRVIQSLTHSPTSIHRDRGPRRCRVRLFLRRDRPTVVRDPGHVVFQQHKDIGLDQEETSDWARMQ